LLEPVRPERLARQGGPFHQARLVRLPLGRHRKAVLGGGGLLFPPPSPPLIVGPSPGRPADRSEIAAPLELGRPTEHHLMDQQARYRRRGRASAVNTRSRA